MQRETPAAEGGKVRKAIWGTAVSVSTSRHLYLTLRLGSVPLAKWVPPPQVLELQQTLAQKDQALGKLEQSLRLVEEASYDGTFLWKITNVTRRCHESACGRTVSLFSPGNSSRKASAGRPVPAPAGEAGPTGPRRQAGGRGWSALTAVLHTVRPAAVQRPGPARPVEVVGSSPPRRVEQGLWAPGWPCASLNTGYILQLGISHLSHLCGYRF